jgi:uncharacterized protein
MGYLKLRVDVVAAIALLVAVVLPCDGAAQVPARREAPVSHDIAAMQALLEQGGDLDAAGRFGRTALHEAAMAGQEASVQWLLDRHVLVQPVDDFGLAPLHLAVDSRQAGVARLLLEAGADPDVSTPNAGPSLVRLLTPAGNLEREPTFKGAWEVAACAAAAQVEMIELLLGFGASIDQPYEDRTALDLALADGRVEVIDCLVQAGGHLGQHDSKSARRAAMRRAADLEAASLVRALLDDGVDPDPILEGEDSFLHVASRAGAVEIVQMLLTAGASPDVVDRRGETPIFGVAKGGGGDGDPGRRNEVVRLLLARGGDPMAGPPDSQADSEPKVQLPVEEAAEEGNADLVRMLLEATPAGESRDRARDRALLQCVTERHVHTAILELLLQMGADGATRDRYHDTLLWKAAFVGDSEAIRLLLEHGAEVDAARGYGETALCRAAVCRAETLDEARATAELLIAADASVNGVERAPRSTDRPPTVAPLVERMRALGLPFVDPEEGEQRIVGIRLAAGGDGDDPQARPLVRFAEYQPQLVPLLLAAGADPNARGRWTTPLCALADGHSRFHDEDEERHLRAEIALTMIRAGATVNGASDPRGGTPLMAAAGKGRTELVRVLLDAGAEVDEANRAGQTALALAREAGHDEVVALLIEGGADPDPAENRAEALIEAVERGAVEQLARLLETGARPDDRDTNDRTALVVAATRCSPDALVVLLEHGADPDRSASDHGTALVAAIDSRECADRETRLAAVQALVDHGADLDAGGADGATALHHAALRGEVDVAWLLEALLAHGADLEARAGDGRTALHLSASRGDATSVRILVERGADVDTVADGYGTALCVAVRSARTTVPRLLVAAGADPDAVAATGMTPLMWARAPEMTRLLLDAGADMDLGDRNGTTALMYAVLNSAWETAAVLLDHGARIEVVDDKGRSALHRAAIRPLTSDDAVMLISRGAQLERRDAYGMTPLAWAAYEGEPGSVEALVCAGAAIDTRDDTGLTPLMWAAACGHGEVVDVLLDLGADPSAALPGGEQASDYAAAGGDDDLARRLSTAAG